MDDQRNSSSPELGFARYGAYNTQGSPSDTPLLFSPPFPAQEPRYLTPAVPIYERRFNTIRRLSQSSVGDPGHFLPPRALEDRASYEIPYQQEEYPEELSPEPLLARQGIPPDAMVNASDFVKKLFKFVSWSVFDPFVFNPYASALEDPMLQSVICWGPLGDRLVIKVCVIFFLRTFVTLPISKGRRGIHQNRLTAVIQAFQLREFCPTTQ